RSFRYGRHTVDGRIEGESIFKKRADNLAKVGFLRFAERTDSLNKLIEGVLDSPPSVTDPRRIAASGTNRKPAAPRCRAQGRVRNAPSCKDTHRFGGEGACEIHCEACRCRSESG